MEDNVENTNKLKQEQIFKTMNPTFHKCKLYLNILNSTPICLETNRTIAYQAME